MSVQEGPIFKRYAANGVAVTYAIPFLLLSENDLQVSLDGVVLTSGFTLFGIPGVNSYAVFSAPPSGDLLFKLVIAFERLVDYQENGDFLANTVNRDFDRLWLAMKSVRQDSGRAITVSLQEPEGVPPLPPAASRANQMMGFDSLGNPIPVAPVSGSANELAIILQDTSDPANGDNKIGVRQPTANAVPLTQHAINLQRVSIQQYGGKDDYNGVTAVTNSFSALTRIIADYPAGCVIHMPWTVGGTGHYYMNGSTGSLDMSLFTVDPAPGVRVFHVGTNTPLIGPGLALTRPLKIRFDTLGYTYSLSAQARGPIISKPNWISAGDAEKPIVEYIPPNTAFLMTFSAVNLSTGALTSAAATVDGDSASFGSISGTGFTVGTIPIRPGHELHALATLPSNFGSLCAFVQTESGWVMFSQDIAGGNLTQRVFIQGSPLQTASLGYPLQENPAYWLSAAEVGIRVHSPTAFSLLANHIEVVRIEGLTSRIVRAGWGAGLVSNVNPAYITYPNRVRNKRTMGRRPIRVVIVGDSISTATNPFCWVDHFKRIIAGAAGVQVSNVLNLAVAGHTAVQQAAIFTATNFQALGGFDYALMMPGVNDIAGGSTSAQFVTAMEQMVAHCATYSIKPIIGLPTMYYDQALSAPYGNVGQNTGNANRGAIYRILLTKSMANLGVTMNYMTMEETGAIVPSLLGNSTIEPMVQDNIHPGAFMAEILGQGWAKSVLGAIACPIVKDVPLSNINNSWLTAAGTALGFALNNKPQYGVVGDTFYLGNIADFNAPFTTGTVVLTLPQVYAPDAPMKFPISCQDNTGTDLAATATFQIDTLGNCRLNNVPATARFANFGSAKWPLRP